MVALPETRMPGKIFYAGRNPLRIEFLEHIAGDGVSVIALDGGIEVQAFHPLPVARNKIFFVQNQGEDPPPPTECCVAFDTLTYIPTVGNQGQFFKSTGKPENEESVQRLFWSLHNQNKNRPYRIRAASILWCNDTEQTAWHDASILLSKYGTERLATDVGFTDYIQYIEGFEHQFNNRRNVTDFAAGLHLETLLAMNCVEAIDDVPKFQADFKTVAERAIFLACVGVSHRILSPLSHTPMKHILTFPHHLDRLALVNKFTGII